MGTPSSPGMGMGGVLRQLSEQKQNTGWLVGRAPWRGRLRWVPWPLGAGPKARDGQR